MSRRNFLPLWQGFEGSRRQERGDSGLYQDPSVGALALAINNALRAIWARRFSFHLTRQSHCVSNQIAEMKALVADLNAGKVDWLVILNANPIYDAPADLEFR